MFHRLVTILTSFTMSEGLHGLSVFRFSASKVIVSGVATRSYKLWAALIYHQFGVLPSILKVLKFKGLQRADLFDLSGA